MKNFLAVSILVLISNYRYLPYLCIEPLSIADKYGMII